MQSSYYERLDQKPFESHYLCHSTIIAHPIEKVWPHALRIGTWMSDHGLETLAGEPGQIGHFERVRPRALGEQVPLPHYHLYGIAEIIPFKCIVLEVFPEKGGSYGKTREWMQFDSLLFADLGSKTELTFLLVEVNLGVGQQNDAESRKRQDEEDGLLRARLSRYFGNLARLITIGN